MILRKSYRTATAKEQNSRETKEVNNTQKEAESFDLHIEIAPVNSPYKMKLLKNLCAHKE